MKGKFTYTLGIFLAFSNSLIGQVDLPKTDTILVKFSIHEILQKGYNADKPGKYNQVVSSSKTKIAPGDSVTLKYLISGYGYIDFKTAKLHYSSSSTDALDATSMIKYGLFLSEDSLLYYGQAEVPLKPNGLIMLWSNTITSEGVIGSTLFDDYNHADEEGKYIKPTKLEKNSSYSYTGTIINAEANLGGLTKKDSLLSLAQFNLHFNDNVYPGDYYFNFILTYFNGESWFNDRVTIKITVLEWYEIYSSVIKWSSIIIGFMTFLTLIRPSFQEICFVAKNIRRKFDFNRLTNEKSIYNAEDSDLNPTNTGIEVKKEVNLSSLKKRSESKDVKKVKKRRRKKRK